MTMRHVPGHVVCTVDNTLSLLVHSSTSPLRQIFADNNQCALEEYLADHHDKLRIYLESAGVHGDDDVDMAVVDIIEHIDDMLSLYKLERWGYIDRNTHIWVPILETCWDSHCIAKLIEYYFFLMHHHYPLNKVDVVSEAQLHDYLCSIKRQAINNNDMFLNVTASTVGYYNIVYEFALLYDMCILKCDNYVNIIRYANELVDEVVDEVVDE